MKSTLTIGNNFSLPLDAVTQTFAILGLRGSGKTNTAVDLMEEMLAAGQQCVWIDPVDVAWGIRSSRDGKGPGFPVTVLGGEHGDLPLEASNGATIADFVVDNHASIILSLRHLAMSDQRRVAADFAERLYNRKGKAANRSPMHVFIDECDEFIPQRIPPGGERMFGAFDRLVRRGRSSGIGLTMISQRPQVVNKDVLSQCETLICHRLLHKLDRKAVDEWIQAHDTEGRRDEFMKALASLERGTAWVWSPSWLNRFECVAMRQRTTFDSSSTPSAGKQAVVPEHQAAVDLDKLRADLAATIEKSKQDDPKELRKKIAELEKKQGGKEEIEQLHAEVASLKQKITAIRSAVSRRFDELIAEVGRENAVDFHAKAAAASLELAIIHPSAAYETVNIKAPSSDLSGPQQQILNTLASTEGIQLYPDATWLALMVGTTARSRGFEENMRTLRRANLVMSHEGGFRLTREGTQLATPALSGQPLNRLRQTISGPQWQILQYLMSREYSAERLAEVLGTTIRSRGFEENVRFLKRHGMIEGTAFSYRIADWVLKLDRAA